RRHRRDRVRPRPGSRDRAVGPGRPGTTPVPPGLAAVSRLRGMVVDDHPMWRDAIARDLDEAGYDVVATVGEGRRAARVARTVLPEVVVLDLQLPDVAGVEVARLLMACEPPPKILVLSASGEQDDVLQAVKAGASGYLIKSASREEFLDAVRRTAA